MKIKLPNCFYTENKNCNTFVKCERCGSEYNCNYPQECNVKINPEWEKLAKENPEFVGKDGEFDSYKIYVYIETNDFRRDEANEFEEEFNIPKYIVNK